MNVPSKQFYLAVATLVGTVIGVGIFGIPFAIGRLGAGLAFAYFAALSGIQLLQHLFYAEAQFAAPARMRLVGLTDRFLGKTARHVAAAATILGFWATAVAYIIVGGKFVFAVVSPFLGGSEFAYQLAWGIIGSIIVYFGLAVVARVNGAATVLLLGAMVAIFAVAAPHIRSANYAVVGARDFLLPYGVILFALSGTSAIPELADIVGHKNIVVLRRAIIFGTLLSAALTAAFGYVVYGVTGGATSEEAIIGLQAVLGPSIATFAAVFGFFAIATSFFPTSLNLMETFEYDYKLGRLPSWLLATGVPIAVFLMSDKSFVGIIGFSGAVFGGVGAVLVALLFLAVRKRGLIKEKPLGVAAIWAYISIILLTGGALYEIISIVAKWRL